MSQWRDMALYYRMLIARLKVQLQNTWFSCGEYSSLPLWVHTKAFAMIYNLFNGVLTSTQRSYVHLKSPWSATFANRKNITLRTRRLWRQPFSGILTRLHTTREYWQGSTHTTSPSKRFNPFFSYLIRIVANSYRRPGVYAHRFRSRWVSNHSTFSNDNRFVATIQIDPHSRSCLCLEEVCDVQTRGFCSLASDIPYPFFIRSLQPITVNSGAIDLALNTVMLHHSTPLIESAFSTSPWFLDLPWTYQQIITVSCPHSLSSLYLSLIPPYEYNHRCVRIRLDERCFDCQGIFAHPIWATWFLC